MSDGSPKVKAPSKPTFRFLAGLSSGILSAVLLQPIDLLKTRVQQSGHHSLRLTLQHLRDSPKGLASLYRGTVPSALRTGFGSAIYFSSLNAIRSHATNIPFLAQNVAPAPPSLDSAGTAFVRSDGKGEGRSSNLPRLSPTGNLLTGATARGFAGLILMPLTVIKVRYESSMYGYTSIAHATRDIISREGVRGLFAGVGATALRDAPYAGLYVLFYEESKKIMGSYLALRDQQNKIQNDSPEGGGRMGVSRAALVNFSSGALAATACSIVSNPFDAIKTRIQLQPGVYRNMWHAARRMVGPEEGRGFRDHPDCILIKRWVPEEEQYMLWKHTSVIRKKRGHSADGCLMLEFESETHKHTKHKDHLVPDSYEWVRKKEKRSRSKSTHRTSTALAYFAGMR